MHSLSCLELQLITVLLLICDIWADAQDSSVWNCVWDVSFWILPHFYYSLYYSRKSTNSSTLKRHNSFQNQNNRKATHSFGFAARPLSFKLQHEVWKVCGTWVSWNSSKTKLFKLTKTYKRFENVSLVTFD